jgi:anti-sigma B factor antagonist
VSSERDVAWVGRVAVITLPAEIDLGNAGRIREDLLSVLEQGASMVIADMSATTFCDSAGVSALVRAARAARERGAPLRVAATAPAVTRVLSITGVNRLIEIFPSAAAALAGPETAVDHEDPARPV